MITQDTPIISKMLKLSARNTNPLVAVGIETVGDLLCWDADSLLKLPIFGEGSLNTVLASLRSYGFELPLNPDEAGIAEQRERLRRRLRQEFQEGMKALGGGSGELTHEIWNGDHLVAAVADLDPAILFAELYSNSTSGNVRVTTPISNRTEATFHQGRRA